LLKLSLVAKEAGTEVGSWVVTREARDGGRDRGRDRIRNRKIIVLICKIWS
jgi:hypothetical protein